MSPGNVADALLRRWYVLVVALLLTAAGAYHVVRPTPSTSAPRSWCSSRR